ncbi:FtsK/SpoIIIE domain-containing protein [Microbacterium oleivorans]|uniref:Cell division protein FtsK n=1 Tax=Microbacterium oleivorans TaxID=273677 RepID=A0A7D5JEA3_9MICO|nr:FtsK/SpoIIIE domain-containing protein [Microbacterium oleivorans]QLD12680.1 cell division protein FtsK [Microbacterium oleivorans]
MRPPTTLDDPIRVPPAPNEPPRPGFPLWAALVPALGAVVLWQVTGSATMLWFAALGPLVALATMLDTARTRRRERRRASEERAAVLEAARAETARRHAREREERWRSTPDVSRYLADPDDIWRSVPGRRDAVVVGIGPVRSDVRVDGDDEATRALRLEAAALDDAPVTVPPTAGIAIVGPEAAARSVARALVAQLCLARAPGDVRVDPSGEPWLRRLPHARARTGLRVWAGAAGASVPSDAELPIVWTASGAPPPRCEAVLRLHGPDAAALDYGGGSVAVRPDALGLDRAEIVADVLAARARAVDGEAAAPAVFADLAAAPDGGLRVALGSDAAGLVDVDLVDDGPHAVVVGVTGSGKSELLVTWIAALAQRLSPDRVVFLLVDFKGGRSFDTLTTLPHVAGVVTDLDEAAALRAIESLAAEVRHRERTLARHGARDVADLDGVLPRLIIVVDEYAALTAAHPRLHETFADIAARGRALGMHLILATQRAAGFREAILANAPLRIALRVTDDTESRAVIGCIDAAALPGGAADRGTALLRGAADTEPRMLRVARCPSEAIPVIARRARDAGHAPVRRPWLPPLPARVPLDDLRTVGRIVLGLADEPEEQRQSIVTVDEDAPGLVVVGRAGAGRSTILRAVAAQLPPERVWPIPADPEAAWDVISALGRAPRGAVVVADDLDLVLGRFPPEYATAAAEALERTAREALGRGIQLVCSVQRVTAAVGRIIDHIPDRVVLATASRADHVALGGEAAHFDARPVPGRGRWRGTLVQFVETGRDDGALEVAADHPVTVWPRHATGFVAPANDRTTATLAAWRARGIAVVPFGPGVRLAPGQVAWAPPETWVARWRSAASTAEQRCQLVVDASCVGEVRLVTGERELPPYATPGRSRAWLFDTSSERVRRVVLPGAPKPSS